MVQKSFKHIIVTDENYFKLKELGQAGDSFNDVVSKLLEMFKNG